MARSYSAGETRKAKDFREGVRFMKQKADELSAQAAEALSKASSAERAAAAEDAREAAVLEKYSNKPFSAATRQMENYARDGGTIESRVNDAAGMLMESYIRNRGEEFQNAYRQYSNENRNRLIAENNNNLEGIDNRLMTDFLEKEFGVYMPEQFRMEAIEKFKSDNEGVFESSRGVAKDAVKFISEWMGTGEKLDLSLFPKSKYITYTGMDKVIREVKSAPEPVKKAALAYLSVKLAEQKLKQMETEAWQRTYYHQHKKALNSGKGYAYEKTTDNNNRNAVRKQEENMKRIKGYIAALEGSAE